MFNMYLSGSSFGPIKNERNSPFYISIEIFLHFSPGVGVLPAMMLRFQARALFSLFNLKARLLFCRKSEILFPGRVSWLLAETAKATCSRH